MNPPENASSPLRDVFGNSRSGTGPGNATLGWRRGYQRAWLRADLIAGITLAAYAIPVSLAYASLAGLPPQAGLYGYLLGGLGYALFGSSRQLAIGPTSAISLVFGLTLTRLAGGDHERLLVMSTLATILVAVMFVVAWALRLSVVVNFISESILVGFKAGAALAIASTQLPKLMGVKGGGDNFFERIWLLAQQTPAANPWVLGISLAALVLLVVGERRLPGRPIALGIVALSLVAVPFAGLTDHGVKVVGAFTGGLPTFDAARFHLVGLDTATLRELARLSFACFVLAYIESISAARTFALKHRREIDARQELLGLGAANVLTGLFQGYPAAGGLSQSAVNEKAGAQTPLSLVFAAFVLALTLVFLTGLFRDLPEAVLAAVVLVAVAGLIDVAEFRRLWRVSRMDFHAALAALGGVLVLGLLDGVIFAIVASLLLLLWLTATPHVAFLGRIPHTQRYSDLDRHPDNERVEGVLAFRVEAALLYFNTDHVLAAVRRRIATEPDLRMVVCDLSNSPYVDLAGARMLRRLEAELSEANLCFKIAEAHAEVRDILRAEGLEEKVGHISRKVCLAEVIDEFKAGPLGGRPTTAPPEATSDAAQDHSHGTSPP